MPSHKGQTFRPLPPASLERPPPRVTSELRHQSSNVRASPRDHDVSRSRAPRRVPAPSPPVIDQYTAEVGYYGLDRHAEPHTEAHLVEIGSQEGEFYQTYDGSPEIFEPTVYDIDLITVDDPDSKAVVVRQQQHRRASPSLSERSSIMTDTGKERKRRSDPIPQGKITASRHPSEHRLAQAPSAAQAQPPSMVRVTDSLNHGHSSRPHALSNTDPQLGMNVNRPPHGPSKLRKSTRFDTSSEADKSSPAHGGGGGGSVSRSAARASLTHRGPDPKEQGSPFPTSKGTKRPRDNGDEMHRFSHKEPQSTGTPRVKAGIPSVKSAATSGDIAAAELGNTHDLFADDDEDFSKLSSDEGTLAELIGDQPPKNVLKSGKLKLDMPKSLDQVIKKVIGPMIKRVVQDRGDVAAKVCDEWEWSRLEVLSAELNSTLDEARHKILGAQKERQGAFEQSKNGRIEYEDKTTGIYKEHGKDYRVLCNDLTGNNHRAVKKIKREIKNESRSQSPRPSL